VSPLVARSARIEQAAPARLERARRRGRGRSRTKPERVDADPGAGCLHPICV